MQIDSASLHATHPLPKGRNGFSESLADKNFTTRIELTKSLFGLGTLAGISTMQARLTDLSGKQDRPKPEYLLQLHTWL